MGVGGTGRGPFASGDLEACGGHGRWDAAAPFAAGGSAAEDGSVLAVGGRIRRGERGGNEVWPGAGGVCCGGGAGDGSWYAGAGVVAVAGGVSGADGGSRIGPARGDEFESGGGTA